MRAAYGVGVDGGGRERVASIVGGCGFTRRMRVGIMRDITVDLLHAANYHN